MGKTSPTSITKSRLRKAGYTNISAGNFTVFQRPFEGDEGGFVQLLVGEKETQVHYWTGKKNDTNLWFLFEVRSMEELVQQSARIPALVKDFLARYQNAS
jgi:hypothetical protein